MRLLALDLPLPDPGAEESETLDFKLEGYAATLASGQSKPSGIAVDATSVYWTTIGEGDSYISNGTVMKAPR